MLLSFSLWRIRAILKGILYYYIRYSVGNVIGTDKTTSYCRSDVILSYTKVHLLNKEKHVLLKGIL